MGDFSIDDIFNDPDFEGLAKDVEKKKDTVSLDPDVIGLKQMVANQLFRGLILQNAN